MCMSFEIYLVPFKENFLNPSYLWCDTSLDNFKVFMTILVDMKLRVIKLFHRNKINHASHMLKWFYNYLADGSKEYGSVKGENEAVRSKWNLLLYNCSMINIVNTMLLMVVLVVRVIALLREMNKKKLSRKDIFVLYREMDTGKLIR